MDGHQFRSQAIHQRRARFPIDRALARLLPRLAQSGRGIRQGNPFHSGGQPKRDRSRTCEVLTERIGALGRHFRVRVLSPQPYWCSQLFALFRLRPQNIESTVVIPSLRLARVRRRPIETAKFDGIYDGIWRLHYPL
jgi:hypothetical protein